MTKIDITPINFGLGLGTATQLRINVDYDLNSPDVTLRCFAYNADGVQLNVTPINLDVPPDKLQEWALDFDPVIAWVLDRLGAQQP